MTNLTNPGHHGSAVIGDQGVAAEERLRELVEQAPDTFRARELTKKKPDEIAVLFLIAYEKVRPGGVRPDALAELEAALNAARKG